MIEYAPLPPYDPEAEKTLTLAQHASAQLRRRFLIQQAYPRFLYKYRGFDASDEKSVDRARDVIVHSRLWLSSPNDFNDPFDMSVRLVMEGTEAQKRRRITRIARNSKLATREARRQQSRALVSMPRSQMLERFRRAFVENVGRAGVYSFAGNPRSILMWSHYGVNHEGSCSAFDVAADIMSFVYTIRMDYSKEYPSINGLHEIAPQIIPALSRKYSEWLYEAERRFIIPDGAHKYKSIRPESLFAVIIGCRATAATVDGIKALLRERASRQLPAVKLLFATKHPSEYALRLWSAQR